MLVSFPQILAISLWNFICTTQSIPSPSLAFYLLFDPLKQFIDAGCINRSVSGFLFPNLLSVYLNNDVARSSG